ncbi:MAG TPA: immunoglobulin domain-containing protein, partial [Bacteroidia bacterium]|nr:immunoglobulin domain-containing protein [Bacteroidia bacterium]
MKKDIYPKSTEIKKFRMLCFSTMIGILMSVTTQPANAQTILISPTGDGGFETGTTFPANGWTLVNASNGNSWCVGTVAKSAGVRGAYVSTSNAGSNNNYSNFGLLSSAARTVHFYRNVTFPAGETQIRLSFKWKCNAAALGIGADNDDIRVFVTPTSVTPASGSAVNATYLVGGPYLLQGSTFQTVQITLPASMAGTTQRLVFSWRNDNNLLGDNPAGAFDEISLTTCAPPSLTASASGPHCAGETLSLSTTAGSSYQWTGPNGFTSTAQNPTITGVTSDNSGTYTVTVTSNGCSSTTTASTTIGLSPYSAGVTSSAASVCENAPFTLNANGGGLNNLTNATDFSIPDVNSTGISSPIVVSSSLNANQVVSVKLNINHS